MDSPRPDPEPDPSREYARLMVEYQLRGRATHDEAVLAAMLAVPRHQFVPGLSLEEAYADRALPAAEGQTVSQPYMVALMTDLLEVTGGRSDVATKRRSDEGGEKAESARGVPGVRVLEVGTGSGYQAAVLAHLGADVVSIERSPTLAESARLKLGQLGYLDRVKVVVGDGTLGWPPEQPYDRILVTAGAPRIPVALREQLADGGRIVIPVGDREQQWLVVVVRHGDQWTEHTGIACRFVPLVGADGW